MVNKSGMTLGDLISADERALREGVTPKTLANERCRSEGPPYYKLHGRIYYSERELQEWYRAQRVDPLG